MALRQRAMVFSLASLVMLGTCPVWANGTQQFHPGSIPGAHQSGGSGGVRPRGETRATRTGAANPRSSARQPQRRQTRASRGRPQQRRFGRAGRWIAGGLAALALGAGAFTVGQMSHQQEPTRPDVTVSQPAQQHQPSSGPSTQAPETQAPTLAEAVNSPSMQNALKAIPRVQRLSADAHSKMLEGNEGAGDAAKVNEIGAGDVSVAATQLKTAAQSLKGTERTGALEAAAQLDLISQGMADQSMAFTEVANNPTMDQTLRQNLHTTIANRGNTINKSFAVVLKNLNLSTTAADSLPEFVSPALGTTPSTTTTPTTQSTPAPVPTPSSTTAPAPVPVPTGTSTTAPSGTSTTAPSGTSTATP